MCAAERCQDENGRPESAVRRGSHIKSADAHNGTPPKTPRRHHIRLLHAQAAAVASLVAGGCQTECIKRLAVYTRRPLACDTRMVETRLDTQTQFRCSCPSAKKSKEEKRGETKNDSSWQSSTYLSRGGHLDALDGRRVSHRKDRAVGSCDAHVPVADVQQQRVGERIWGG